MFKKIMVPLDGSTFGEFALPVAYSLAEKGGGSVEAVTVVTPLTPAHFAEPSLEVDHRWFQEAMEEAESYLERVRDRMGVRGGGTALATTVLPGPVVHSLERHAHQGGADLVVLTTHGRGPLQRAWLGSVADGLVRRLELPILLVQPQEEGEPDLTGSFQASHMMIPLDGSDRSREVLEPGLALARLTGAKVTLVHVVPPHLPVGSMYIPHMVLEQHEDQKRMAAAKATLDALAAELRAQGVDVSAEVLTGDRPAPALLSHMEEHDVGLMAMATAGRGGVSRLVLGSVADKVARGSQVPVLLVRAPEA